MALLNGSADLPLSVLSCLESAKESSPPTTPVLRHLANYIHTATLSSVTRDSINLVGNLLVPSHKQKQGQAYQKWRHFRIQMLLQDIEVAASLEVYEQCAKELDMLQGHDIWKATFDSIEPDYNPRLIQENMAKLKDAADLCDVGAMLHLLRTSLNRDLGGMSLLRMYKHSWYGTKELIDDYMRNAVHVVDRFLEVTEKCNVSTAESRYYQKSLEDALKFFGRSALTLSGGANLGMKHVGVVKALWEAGLLPDIISGASAGSIIAAIVGSHNDKEMAKVLEDFPDGDLAVFDDLGVEGVDWVKQRGYMFMKTRAFFAISNLKRVMMGWLKDMTFREAHNKTGRAINICVSSADSSEPRLLNYITSPNVYLWSAVCASCSVPFIFQPATIYERDPRTGEPKVWMLHSQYWVDGSLDSDIPMRKLSEMFNVNFFIVSQVNPHVRWILQREEEFKGVQPTRETPRPHRIRTGMNIAREELIHRAQIATNMGVPSVITRGASVFSQQYTGDINIFPKIEKLEYLSMMANPTPDFMRLSTISGERATWPKMCRVKNSVAIEVALLRAINVFRDRVNFGPEAAKARQEARQPLPDASRGRTKAGRLRRRSFLRRLSLSNDFQNPFGDMDRRIGLRSPSPNRAIKRNNSAGSIVERQRMGLKMTRPNMLTPQAGVSDELTTLIGGEERPQRSKSVDGEFQTPAFNFALEDESDIEDSYTIDCVNDSTQARVSRAISPPLSSPIKLIKSFLGGHSSDDTSR